MDLYNIRLKKLYQVFKVPIFCSDKGGEKLCSFGVRPENDAFYVKLSQRIAKQAGPPETGKPVVETFEDSIYVGYFTYQGNCFIFGPVVYYLVSDAALRSFSAAEHIALKDEQFVLSEYSFFYQMLMLSAMLVTNQAIDDAYSNFDQEDFEQNLLKDLSDIDNYRLKLSEYGKVNISRKLEYEVMRLIKSGDEEKLVQLFNRSVNLLTRVGSMAENPKKQYEYMAVIGVSLAARAAMDSGINARKAYAINDVYLQKIEKCADVQELLHTAAKAVILYTRMVKEKRQNKPFSRHVAAAVAYIEQNLTNKLTCNIVAQKIGLSPDYLSKIFLDEVKMPIKKYIQRERVNKACNLLRFSQMPIQEIGHYLGFPNQSYFGKVFKSEKGVTPQNYRLNKREG